MLIWVFLLIVPLLGGCWDQVELTERGFVMGMALDVADEGKIEMTVQLFRPMQATGLLSGDSKSGNLITMCRSSVTACWKGLEKFQREPAGRRNGVISVSCSSVRSLCALTPFNDLITSIGILSLGN